MNVPNHEKKSFREMTAEEQSAIVEALISDGVEYFNKQDESWDKKTSSSMLVATTAYRTKPRQLIIPWEVIKPEYKWAAMDADGEVYVFTEKPSLYNYCFNGCCAERVCALNIDTTGIDLRESLVQRPDGV